MDFKLLRLFKLPVLLPPKLKAHLFLPALGLELGVLGVFELMVVLLELLLGVVVIAVMGVKFKWESSEMAIMFSTL